MEIETFLGQYDENEYLTALNELTKQIKKSLDASGIFYRFWSRIKSKESLSVKLKHKMEEYSMYSLTDLIGCRIACYFEDDVEICCKLLSSVFTERKEHRSETSFSTDVFAPERKNYIFEIPSSIIERNGIVLPQFISYTFEVQFRTIFSEGWHEVEHDLRYKHQKVWHEEEVLSRQLNAIFATLQTSDWALLKVAESLAYNCYKSKKWEDMIRNKFRLRLGGIQINDKIATALYEDVAFAKEVWMYSRKDVIMFFSHTKMPVNVNNIVWYINSRVIYKNSSISNSMPKHLEEEITKYISTL